MTSTWHIPVPLSLMSAEWHYNVANDTHDGDTGQWSVLIGGVLGIPGSCRLPKRVLIISSYDVVFFVFVLDLGSCDCGCCGGRGGYTNNNQCLSDPASLLISSIVIMYQVQTSPNCSVVKPTKIHSIISSHILHVEPLSLTDWFNHGHVRMYAKRPCHVIFQFLFWFTYTSKPG